MRRWVWSWWMTLKAMRAMLHDMRDISRAISDEIESRSSSNRS